MHRTHSIPAKPKWFFPTSFYISAAIFVLLVFSEKWLDMDPVDAGTLVFFALFASMSQVISLIFYRMRIKLANLPFAIVCNAIGIMLLYGVIMTIVYYP